MSWQYLADVPVINAFAAMATSVLTYLSEYGGPVLDHLNLVVAVSHLSGDKPYVTVSTNVALPKELTLEGSESPTRAEINFVRGKIAIKLIRVRNEQNEFDACLDDGESGSLLDNRPSGGKKRWSRDRIREFEPVSEISIKSLFRKR